MSVGNEFDGPFASCMHPSCWIKVVMSCYPRFSSSLRLHGQLKHLTFTKALLYLASQQYETEWTIEAPENREELDFYGWTIQAIITGRHFIQV